MRRAAVLGHPVAHSLSPVLHRAAYAELGLTDWVYERHDVTADRLPRFVADLDADWAGLSLTMPLKVAVLALADHVEPLAAVVGAANTLLVDSAGRPSVAANTDVGGMVAALAEVGLSSARTGVVIGGGATAASALAVLGQLGVHAPVVAARSPARAGALLPRAARMGLSARLVRLAAAAPLVATADIVVSTVPDGTDQLAAALTHVRGTLLDIRYDVLPTPMQAAWLRAGGFAMSGERVLLHQAVEQVRLMTGRPAPRDAMDDALRRALAGG